MARNPVLGGHAISVLTPTSQEQTIALPVTVKAQVSSVGLPWLILLRNVDVASSCM